MFKVINGGKLPTRGSRYSAFVDLYANENVVIGAGETKVIGLGVCIDEDFIFDLVKESKDFIINMDKFQKTHYLQLEPRSSLRVKGLIAGTGIIDIDYKDEIKIVLHNLTKEDYTIQKDDRIAQISLIGHKSYLFDIESDDIRTGGFGSTKNN